MEKNNCEHKIWRRTGLWDGEDKNGNPTGGPVINCVDCNLEKRASYEEWAQIEKAGQAEIEKTVKRPNWFKPAPK